MNFAPTVLQMGSLRSDDHDTKPWPAQAPSGACRSVRRPQQLARAGPCFPRLPPRAAVQAVVRAPARPSGECGLFFPPLLGGGPHQ